MEFFPPEGSSPGGDIYIFDYGCIACWGLTRQQETNIISIVKYGAVGPFTTADYEVGAACG